MRSLLEGTVQITDESVHKHIDQCLGCRACETACPAGVPYGHLLEATRATLRAGGDVPFLARFTLWIFAHPLLMSLSMLGARLLAATPNPTVLSRLKGRIIFAMAILAASTNTLERGKYSIPKQGARGKTAILRGCVMEGLFSETNRATERVLAVNGYSMIEAPGQRCCGALHAHAGDLNAARKLARKNIQAFEKSGAEWIAVNAAGCGAMMKEYAHLLAEDPEWADRAAKVSARVRDVTELLAEAGPLPGGPLPFKVTYDAPCHLQHAQRVTQAPFAVLSAIPGLELIPLHESDQCCGAAGIYNLIEPETSDLVLDRKLANIAETGARFVTTGNPGCLMQIGAGLIRDGADARSIHPVDLLDASYAAREKTT
jgi:glycolate oxidase iron-sulfur subunit